MLSVDVVVKGRVFFESGQGVRLRVPLGACTAEAHQGFVCLVWMDGGRERSAILSAQQFEDCLTASDIVVAEAGWKSGTTRL